MDGPQNYGARAPIPLILNPVQMRQFEDGVGAADEWLRQCSVSLQIPRPTVADDPADRQG